MAEQTDDIVDLRDPPAEPRNRGSRAAAALRRHLPEFVVLLSIEGRVQAALNVPDDLAPLVAAGAPHVGELVHPDDLPSVLALGAQAVARPGTGHAGRGRLRRPGGGWLLADLFAVDARHDPDLAGLVVRVRPRPDLDPSAAAADGLSLGVPGVEEANRFVSLAEALPVGILSADGFGTVAYVNAAAEELLDRRAEDLLGAAWEQAVHLDDRPTLVDAVALVLDTGTRQRAQFRLADDPQRWVEASLTCLGDPARPVGWLATLEDATERRRAQQLLAHQATHDPLTHLPNRTLLDDRLRLAGRRLRREGDAGGAVVALFVDLDDFKDVNDTYGHAAGDQVLAELGRRLAESVRATDTVARFGGDEFVAVCERLRVGEVEALVERIRSAVRSPIRVGGATLSVDATIGVASTDEALDDMGELLRRADADMYRRKRARTR